MDASRRVVLLGGYGATGRALAPLLRDLGLVVIAGRRADAAEAEAEALRASGVDAEAEVVDVSDLAAVRRALEGALLAVALTATPALAEGIAGAAIGAGTPLVDAHYQDAVWCDLQPLDGAARAAGVSVLAQAGFHPGLVAPMVRAVAAAVDRPREVAVAMAMRGEVDPQSLREIVDMLQDYRAEVFDAGWRRATGKDMRRMDLGPPFGVQRCAPLTMAELDDLPAELDLERLGMYAAGWGFVADWIVAPIAMAAGRIRMGLGRERLARWLAAAVNRHRGPEATVMTAEAVGSDGARARLQLRDPIHPYHLTAAGIALAARQLVDGRVAPGVTLAGGALDPAETLAALPGLGVEVRWLDPAT